MFSSVSQAQVDPNCVERMKPQVGYNSDKAIQACQQGATPECVAQVKPDVGYDTDKAIQACLYGAGRDGLFNFLSASGRCRGGV